MNENTFLGKAKGFDIKGLGNMIETKGSKGEKSIMSYIVDAVETHYTEILDQEQIDRDMNLIAQSVKGKSILYVLNAVYMASLVDDSVHRFYFI